MCWPKAKAARPKRSHSTQATGKAGAQTQGDAKEPAETRSTVVAHRSGEEGSRTGVQLCEYSSAKQGRRSHSRNLLVSGRQDEAEESTTARWSLSAAVQSNR